MRLRSVGLAAILLVACSNLAACGGSDGEVTTRTVTIEADGPPTKAQFVEEVDAVCAKVNPEIDALNDRRAAVEEEAESNEDFGRLADFYGKAVSIVEAGAEELRSLTPPAADAEIYDEYLRSVERQLLQLEAFTDAVADGDLEEVEEVSAELKATDATTAGIAKGYGFEVCGTD